MLNLTRKTGEFIYIYPRDLRPDMTVAELFSGGDISFQILEVKNNQVRIGIEAPNSLTIMRDDAKSTQKLAG